MPSSDDRLYNLLPAIYRIRDVAEGESLRALLAVIEQELRILESDVSNLYDNWFIETCQEWLVPYIGDLLDVRELDAGNRSNNTSSQRYGQQERRAYIANTLAYRRRKGTAPVLEQLARDVSGWRSRAVEFSRLILTTQNLNHLRPLSATVDLRADNSVQLVGTPFEQQASYTAEIRSTTQGGRYNAPNLGLYVWRLQSYPVDRSTARIVTTVPEGLVGRCYSFNPLGDADIPLFNQPQTETDITTLAQEINVPGMLRRVTLAGELKQRRQLRLQGQRLEGIRYFDTDPVLQIFVNGQPAPIPPEEILICRLQTEAEPNSEEDANPLRWRSIEELSWDLEDVLLPTKVVAVDPELGRIMFLDQSVPRRVEVSYLYGFSDDLGGGSYTRYDASLDPALLPYTLITPKGNVASLAPEQYRMSARIWEVEQATTADANPLETAIQRWNQTVQSWEGLRQQTCIPLARITTSGDRISQPNPIRLREALRRITITPQRQERLYTRCKPGVLGTGLRVIVRPGCAQVMVRSGRAIDRQGRLITILDQNKPIALEEWGITATTTETRVLVVFYRSLWQRQQNAKLFPSQAQPSLQLISPAALDEYEPGTFIPLARLEIQNGQIVTKTDEYPQFQPGIIQGFEVRIPIGTLTAIIQPGLAVDEQGRKIRTTENTQFDLSPYQDQNGFLVLALRSELGSLQYQFEFVQDEDFNNNLNTIYIPLAYLSVPKVTLTIDYPARWVSGFEVKPRPGELAVTVTPGKAIIGSEPLERAPDPVPLNTYQEQRVLIALTTGINNPQRGEIAILLLDAIIQFTDYLPLAEVEVPKLSGNKEDNIVRVYPVRRVLQGLGVSISGNTPVITISPGQAIDASGKETTLEQQHQFDLSRYPGRTFVLFLSHQPGQGFPIPPIDPAKPQDWQQLGLVPQEPNPSQVGIIWIKDAATYCGDLSILVPKGRCLQLIATNGYQPHVQGNVWVRGTATATDFQQGELLLDGLLIEGQVSVLPGNLEQLQIHHCTLVPRSGGLRLRSSQPLSESDDDEGLTLIAMVIYCLSYVWQLICRELGWLNASTPKAPAQMIQFSLDQLSRLLTEVWQMIQHWLGSDGNQGDGCSCWELSSSAGQENSRLEISLYRSISGPLLITDKVPTLRIEDCLIDKGHPETETSGVAIAAPGTDADIQTTTVFGITAVRTLEASNSLFTEKVIAFRHQTGCLRFTYVPEGSKTPRRYQCQPDMAFKRELDRLPEAITTIQINAAFPYHEINSETNTLTDRQVTIILAGTAGNGLFRSLDQGETWIEMNQNLADRYISAMALYSRYGTGSLTVAGTIVTGAIMDGDYASTRFSQELQPGDILTIANQSRTVVEISNDRRLKVDAPFHSTSEPVPFQIQTLVAGTSSGRLFRSQNLGQAWAMVSFNQSNAIITAFLPWQRSATGTIEVRGTEVKGIATRFTAELRSGDTITINVPKDNQMVCHTRVVVAIGKPGTGTISSRGIRITGTETDFATELQIGDTITALNPTSAALNQTRTVIRLNPDGSNPDLLEVNAPFTGDLAPGTRFEINRDTILRLNAALASDQDQAISNVKMQINQFIMTTAGGGVFRATEQAENWEQINSGLTNLNTTALAIHPETGQLLVGTGGNGVFLLQPEDSQNKSDDRWQPVNTGLKNRYVTALVNDSQGQLFAATAGGGVFRFVANRDSWIAVNQGITNLDITALTVCPSVDSTQKNDRLIAGTSDGKLFESIDAGESWDPTRMDSQGIDVTALASAATTAPDAKLFLFAGTIAGDLLYFSQAEQTWLSVNHSATKGLPNAAAKLQIIDRLQPRFTSTRYGDPVYGQLSQSCAPELRMGAEDGAEMGAFNGLKQSQRQTNLEASLEENLRFGLDIGIFYVT